MHVHPVYVNMNLLNVYIRKFEVTPQTIID